MVLDVAVEHGLPELHGGPDRVLLYAAVGKLSDACSQFLSEEHRHTFIRDHSNFKYRKIESSF